MISVVNAGILRTIADSEKDSTINYAVKVGKIGLFQIVEPAFISQQYAFTTITILISTTIIADVDAAVEIILFDC